MFTRIRSKLFGAILAANGLLLLAVYLSANWIFSSGFQDYLDRKEASRLQPLVSALAGEYRLKGGWQWVRRSRNGRWQRLLREYLKPRDFAGEASNLRPPPPPPLPGDDIRLTPPPPGAGGRPPPGPRDLLLRSTDQAILIGPRHLVENAFWIPIEVDNTTVGHLGFVRQIAIGDTLQQVFSDRVNQNLLWLVLGMLVITALVTMPLAARFVLPIERLRAAFHELAMGNYRVSLPQGGRDELADLQRDFNRLADTMDRNLAARQRWIADISHELRTPVAVMRGEIEAVIDGVRKLDNVYVKSLHQEVMRLSRLIDDLHQLSISDHGALDYRNRSIDLSQAVRDAVEQMEFLCRDEDFEIESGIEAGDYPVFADTHRLQQLFANLTSNSRFYSEIPAKIRVGLKQSGNRAVIEWEDSAPGVSDEELGLLFERLYRVEGSRNRNTGGSGLGLAICRNIVDAMQGEIELDHSTLGGLKIRIVLPLMETE